MKINKFVFFILSVVMVSCSSVEKAKSPPTNLVKLDSIANFLVLVSDNEPSLKEKCGLSSSDAMNLLQPLHAMIDEDLANFSDSMSEDDIKNCQKECHCGLYSDLSSKDSIKEKLLDDAKNTDLKTKVNCAERSAKWLCSDPILKKLKAEVEPVANGL